MKPWKIIQMLETDNSRLFKENVINEYGVNSEFELGVITALDPFITFGIKQIPLSKKDGPGLSWDQFHAVASKFVDRTATGNHAKELIDFLISLATIEEWNDWYRRILLKDFKCGVSEKTFTKCGYEIPSFNCMLASNGENNKHMKGDCLVEYKYDGVRAITIVEKNIATIYSRNGKQLSNFPHIEEALSQPEFNNMVFDGEVMSANFQALMKQVHRKSGADTADAFLALFDVITLEEFNNGKSETTLLERKEIMDGMVFADCIHKVDYYRINMDTEEQKFLDLNKVALKNGYEGLMIKPVDGIYECKRSNLWFKIKPFIEVTLGITSVEEGNGRFEGTTGAIVCEGFDEGVDIKVNVGGGLSDALRDAIWKNKDACINQLVEIRADAISQNQDGTYSLRFPRFKTFRGFNPGEKL